MSNRGSRRGSPAGVVRLRIAYDGADFGGSQRQGSNRTVQGELERVVESVIGHPVPVYLAGRTDKGVHAAGQAASFADSRPDLADETLRRALLASCPVDMSVVGVSREALGFHARYDAKWREYRYWIWFGSPQPLARRTVWCAQRDSIEPLLVSRAAELLTGEHDFASFASGGQGIPDAPVQEKSRGTVRTVFSCSIQETDNWWGAMPEDGTLYGIQIVANGFLPRMVRGIVGAFVEIGRGNRPVDWMSELLEAKDRRLGPKNAPAHGLTLWSVGYGTEKPSLH